MFAVGHIALGYITGKILGKLTKHDPDIPLLWTLSLLPDIDFLIPGIIHRGPTHSLILALIIFAPFLIKNPKKTLPYFTALLTHSIIADFITYGGVMLLWPLSTEMMGYRSPLTMGRAAETRIELALFAALILVLIASGDLKNLLTTENRNLILFVPLCTIVLPAAFKYPVKIPGSLLIAHLILIGMIALFIIKSIIQLLIRKLRASDL
jgi:hypothetical protein